MRERRAGDSEVGYDLPMASSVVDYTKPGAASRPPDFSGIGRTPKRADELTDGRVPPPIDRVYQPDLSRLPNSKRRDRYEVEKELIRQQLEDEAAHEESDVTSWDALMARDGRQASTVDFSSRSPMGGLRDRPQRVISNSAAAGMAYGPMPADYTAATLGQAVRSVQPPPPNRGPQKHPHIIQG